MRWHIGQDIVCIKTHPEMVVVEGGVYTIRGLRKNCCCIEIDIGVDTNRQVSVCSKCGRKDNSNNVHWLGEFRFEPLDSLADISELVEIIEQKQAA